MSKKTNKTTGLSRRAVLKGAVGLAGAAAGSGAITGFPAVWSQEDKVLRYLGTAVNQSDDITKKVKAETGITIQNIVATTDDVTKRVITQPNSFDILDTEYFSLKKLVPSGQHPADGRQEDQGVRQHHAGLHQGPIAERQGDRRSGHGAEEGDVR